VPRRFLDAGRLSVHIVSLLPASKNWYKLGPCELSDFACPLGHLTASFGPHDYRRRASCGCWHASIAIRRYPRAYRHGRSAGEPSNEVVKIGPNAAGFCSAVVALDDPRKNWRHSALIGHKPLVDWPVLPRDTRLRRTMRPSLCSRKSRAWEAGRSGHAPDRVRGPPAGGLYPRLPRRRSVGAPRCGNRTRLRSAVNGHAPVTESDSEG
jgi:hypothetical protein